MHRFAIGAQSLLRKSFRVATAAGEREGDGIAFRAIDGNYGQFLFWYSLPRGKRGTDCIVKNLGWNCQRALDSALNLFRNPAFLFLLKLMSVAVFNATNKTRGDGAN